jgi:CSLREA domain-containing protein
MTMKKISLRGTFVLLVVISVLFAPSTAGAASFVVDSVGDTPDFSSGAPCETETGSCTLRAALEVANLQSGRDDIKFDSAVFNGSIAGTIAPQSELPAITEPLTIKDQCPLDQFGQVPQRPCAAIDAGGAIGLRIESDEVAIEDLSITDATTAIDVIASSDDFVARNDWIGANLHREAGSNSTGIFLGPGANDAGIGVYVAGWAGGNLIVNNTEVGLDLEGASRNRVVDNEFGLQGKVAAPNGKDIEITDVEVSGSVVKADENEIGTEISRFGELTNSCDEGCNVISGALTSGIDFRGDGGRELPASGPTTIRSNFIGTDRGGEVAIPNEYAGIVVGGADKVTIGGSQERDGNVIVGGLWGTLSGPESRELVIENNRVGQASDWSTLDPPTVAALSVDSHEILYPEGRAKIVGNSIVMGGGTAIDATGTGAFIVGNSIYGGDLGIRASGDAFSLGDYIVGNELVSPGVNGILLQSEKSRVLGNVVVLAIGAGIKVEASPATSVREDEIGGTSEETENEIEWSGGPAVEVAGGESSFVSIWRNVGRGNGGPFIDLGGDGSGNQPSGPNGGIQAPVVETATRDQVSGSGAEPGAAILVFLKSSAAPGEIDRFLASGVGGAGGKWSVDFHEPLPGGSSIAVDQVAYQGTSELAIATTDGDERSGNQEACPLGSSGCEAVVPRQLPPDTRQLPPNTKISKGPPKRTRKTTARFTFSSSEPGPTFQCKLDGRLFMACRSPRAYKNLRPGKHLFEVRAVGEAGIDPTPAVRKFTVLRNS